MNLSVSLISTTPDNQTTGYQDVSFAVSGPGLSGTLNLTIDPSQVQVNAGNKQVTTDLLSSVGNAAAAAEAALAAAALASEAAANQAAEDQAAALATAAQAAAATAAADTAQAAQAQQAEDNTLQS